MKMSDIWKPGGVEATLRVTLSEFICVFCAVVTDRSLQNRSFLEKQAVLE